MSELKKIYFINTCIPHIARDSIFIGEFPVDSDVFVNFNRAFNDLDYVGINIFYKFGIGTILIDELKSLQAIDDNLNHDDIIIVFNSINENINEGNNEAISHNISSYIKNKYTLYHYHYRLKLNQKYHNQNYFHLQQCLLSIIFYYY
jgi:hypothetical protein